MAGQLRRVTAVVVSVVVSTSCAGTGTGERELSREEAARLAEVTYLNHRRGAAQFEVATLADLNGTQLALSGVVDWSNTRGSAKVSHSQAGGTLTELSWRANVVFERRPTHDALLQSLGAASSPYFGRAIDMRRRVDQVVSIIMGLAATQPENAILIQQKPGTKFIRSDTLRGKDVDVLRYGTRSIYWVERVTGEMLRFEGNNDAGTLPIVVDFDFNDVATIRFPEPAQVVFVDDKPDLSAFLAGL